MPHLRYVLVVARLGPAEEGGHHREDGVHRRLQALLAFRCLDQLGAEIEAELRVALLRHGLAREVAQGMERVVQQVLDLQDLGEVAQQLDGDELFPVLERVFEDRERLLRLSCRGSFLLGDAHLAAELEEVDVMAVLLHRHAAGRPFRVRRRRIGDRWLVEDLRAVELVDRVADDDLSAPGGTSAWSLSSSTVFTCGAVDIASLLDQTTGSVLNASRSVESSVNLAASSRSSAPASASGVQSPSAFEIPLRDRGGEQEDLAAAHAEELAGNFCAAGARNPRRRRRVSPAPSSHALYCA